MMVFEILYGSCLRHFLMCDILDHGFKSVVSKCFEPTALENISCVASINIVTTDFNPVGFFCNGVNPLIKKSMTLRAIGSTHIKQCNKI